MYIFQRFSRIRSMHGAHWLVWAFVVLIYSIAWLLFLFVFTFNFTILRFSHPVPMFCVHFFCFFFSFCDFTVKHTCGEEAAHFTRNFLDRMSFSLRRVSWIYIFSLFLSHSSPWYFGNKNCSTFWSSFSIFNETSTHKLPKNNNNNNNTLELYQIN